MRGLGLQGAPNARDLGGLVTGDGRIVRQGVLFRAPALGRLTDPDVSRLGELGLRTVVDLRGEREVAVEPPDRLPHPPPHVAGLPIYDPRHPAFTYIGAVLSGQDGAAEYAALAEEGTPGAMIAIYRWLVSGDLARARFGQAVRLLADPGRLPALAHCSVGKDRTGWLTAVVLTILGVERAAIEADYLATNEASAPAFEQILERMRRLRPDVDPDHIRPVLEARPLYLAAAYAEVDRVYGGFDAYLRHGLGLDDRVLDALRANLLD